MHTFHLARRFGAATLGLVLLAGCGSGNTAAVTGTVKMDDQPLSNAIVEFIPQTGPDGSEGGRPAVAQTDSEGRYELVYGRGTMGAVPGTYRVEIRTYAEPNPDGETPEEIEGVPERVPAQYNADSELVKTVEARGNVIDFELVSEGEIKLPAGAGGGGGGYGGGY